MAEVGRVTPGKPIWPEPHRDLPDRRRNEQEQDAEPSPEKAPAENPASEPPEEPGTHIDEYV